MRNSPLIIFEETTTLYFRVVTASAIRACLNKRKTVPQVIRAKFRENDLLHSLREKGVKTIHENRQYRNRIACSNVCFDLVC